MSIPDWNNNGEEDMFDFAVEEELTRLPAAPPETGEQGGGILSVVLLGALVVIMLLWLLH